MAGPRRPSVDWRARVSTAFQRCKPLFWFGDAQPHRIGPLPHPATHRIIALGGRVGERAGAEADQNLGLMRVWRSIAIRMPRQIRTVICAEPPKLTSGSGMPTTGASPITMPRLIAT